MKRSPLFIVFITVFIDLMGFGIVIPLLPLYGQKYQPSPVVFGLLMAVYSLMQFLALPVLGRLSDRFGRRPILVLSLAGTVAGYLLFALQNSLGLLFLSRIVGGVMGGNVATAQAVIADVTKPEDRAKGMGLIGAAFGLGFILGPAIGGVALSFGESVPGFFAAGLSAVALAVAAMILPETWPKERRETKVASHRDWFSLHRLVAALRHPQIGLVMVMFFLTTFAFANFEATFALLLNHRFKLDALQVTHLFVFVGVLAAFVQGGLVGRLVKRYGERRLAFTGILLLLPAYLAVTAVAAIPPLLGVLVFLALGAGLVGPSLSSLVSRLSSSEEQGGVLGVYQSLSSLARILGPFFGVFAFEKFGADTPYFTAAGVSCLALGIAALLLSRTPAPADLEPEPSVSGSEA